MKRPAAEEIDLLRGLYAPPAAPAETAAPEVLEYPHRGYNFPRAEIRLGQHDDGRWMWATSFHTALHGVSYALLPKWGNFASTRDEALQGAVDELRKRFKGKDDCAALGRWLDTIRTAQNDLFAEAQ